MIGDIYGRIEKRLETLGISAQAASVGAGLSKDAIRGIKRTAKGRDGYQGINLTTILKLATVLKTTVEWLATGEGPETVDRDGESRCASQATDVRVILDLGIPYIPWALIGDLANAPPESLKWLEGNIAGGGTPKFVASIAPDDDIDEIAGAGEVIVIDLADRELEDNAVFLFRSRIGVVARVWKREPSRLVTCSHKLESQQTHNVSPFERLDVLGRVRGVKRVLASEA